MILVTGANGFVGRHLVERLREGGQQVRVLAPSRYHRRLPAHWLNQIPDEETGAVIEVFDGSIFDAPLLLRAMLGTHTVFHLASAQWWGNLNDLNHVDREGTENVLTAARSARIGRLLYLSHIGAEPASAWSLLRIKGLVEDRIRKSGLAYTIFRCGILFGEEDRFVNNIAMMLRTNPLVIFQPGSAESLLNPLYIDDLTESLFRALEEPDLVDTTVEIGGIEYMTYNEMIRTVMRVSGSQRYTISLPPYLLRWLTRVMHRIFPRWPITPQWFDVLGGNRTAPTGNLFSYTGVRPRRFEDTLLTYMPKRRYFFELLRYLLRRRPRPVY